MIQLPSIVIADFFVPKASPPHPESSWFDIWKLPALTFRCTYSRASVTSGVFAAPADASSLSHQPPFWTTKAPRRSMPTPMPRPAWSPVVSFLDTASSSSQVVGTSASDSPAFVHESVLIWRASVEKSFGTQYCFPSYVKAWRSGS